MTVSQATARQPSLITPLNSLLSVMDLTGEIIDFTFTNTDLNSQHGRNRSCQNFCVNTAPCRMLAWGKSLLNVKSCVSPTGPDHSKNRETVFSDHCHQTGPVSGGRRDRNVCQTSQMSRMWHTSACRVQTNPVSGLRKPWGGCTLGSTMLKEGYTLPFQSRPSLTRSPKLSNAMHIFTGTYIG